MPILISQVITPYNVSEEQIIAVALKKVCLSLADTSIAGIHKSSLDARKNTDIKLVSSVWIELSDEILEQNLADKYSFCKHIENIELKPKTYGSVNPDGRIVIAGFGPAGMFAALILAEYGYKPLVLERGNSIDERVDAVNSFWKDAILDTATNVQFGEGGAGTFSDGKLTTRINSNLCRYILEKLTELGAPNEILSRAKPHIGTDKLRTIVKNLRERVISLGGEVRFLSQITDISIKNGKISSVTVNNNEQIKTEALILAIGHSARDTFEMLLNKGVFIEPKPFSIGARIEHTRESVNQSLYGKHYKDASLPSGEYQLSYRLDERAVYTFCMCPGGYVVPSQSEENTIVVNGMSEFSRNAKNSNSAMVVSVSPDDFGKGPLDGVKFAQDIEHKAYNLAGKNYTAPACTVGQLLDGNSSLEKASVSPSYSIGVTECDFRELFPNYITEMMQAGIRNFAGKMHCFGDRNAVLTAPETRTSSPIKITRNDNMQSLSIASLYPCGEGAGYAGGIVSAAVDGVNCALKIIETYTTER